MDNHSRSASPREPTRPQHRPPSPPSPAGFDNRAYQHDESDPNHNDSFTSNGAQQNGHTKEPNGVTDAKAFEAVNLELINLTPKNGSAKQKKDVEVDMNATNPYDEYFVPVNEHRKYMRGEKLYVTADKRGEKAGCKRPLCWTMLALVVAAIVAIIVLAATGVLFSNSPTPLEQYNTSVSSARALGGITPVQRTDDHSGDDNNEDHTEHDHSLHDHSMHDHSQHDHSQHDHAYDNTQPDVSTQEDSGEAHSTEPSQQHGPDTQSDDGQQHVAAEEANDNNVYVPKVVEGEVTVDNEEFIQAFEDPDSREYDEFVTTFTEGLKRALFERNELDSGDNEITVEVVQLRKGSVIVTYRIHWTPKPNTTPEEDLFNPTSLETNLNEYLARNNRMISTYHIAEDKVAARRVLDLCQINKNGCEYGCEFDETTLDFTCTCPHGQILHMADPRKCIPLFENNENQDHEKESRVLNVDSNPSSVRNIPMEEKPATESVEIGENTFDWKDSHHIMPETTTEVDSDVNFSHIFGNPTQHEKNSDEVPAPEPTAEPKAEPEPTAEPKSEPEPSAEPKAEPEPSAEPNAEPEPTAEPNTEPEQSAEPKAEPEPSAEPKVEPEPTVEPKSEPELVTETEAQPEPTSEPKTEPEPTAEPKAEPEPTAEPNAEPEPIAEPKAEPEPTAEPKAEPEPEPTAEQKSEPEPTAEPNTIVDSKPRTEESAETTIPVLETEPQSEPEPKSESELKPNSEAAPDFDTDVNSEHIHEPNSEPKLEATAESANLEGVESVTMHELESKTEQNPQASSETVMQTHFNSIFDKNNDTAMPTHTLNPLHIASKDEQTTEGSKAESLPTLSPQEEILTNVSNSVINPQISNLSDKTDNIPVTDEPKPTLTFDSTHDSELHTDHLNTAEEKSVLYTNEGKFEYKPSEDHLVETTTLRVSISEPNIINEPSYEPKPEIISILSNAKEQAGDDVFETTTTESDWLESEAPKDVRAPVAVTNMNNDTDKITYEDIVNVHPENEINQESEQRSFKNIDAIYETTTPVNSLDGDISFTHITKVNDPVTETVLKANEATTLNSIIMVSTTTTETSTEPDRKISTDSTLLLSNVDSANSKTESTEKTVLKTADEMKHMSVINYLMDEDILKRNETNNDVTQSTTPEVDVATDIYNHPNTEQIKKSIEQQSLNDLENNNHTVQINNSSGIGIPTESADITFDAINMMFNRSSKVIKDLSNDLNKTEDNISDNSELRTETEYKTTESDWLSEPVTEISLSDAMNKMENPEIHTTTIKIEDIMPHGLSKEDFEPDYFSSIGNGNNKPEQDGALYGMVQDYDNEDNRFKRVNQDKLNLTESAQADSNEIFKINDMTSPLVPPIETTTVREYIYTSSQKYNEEPIVMLEALNQTDSINSTPTAEITKQGESGSNSSSSAVVATPAPVWEESEGDKHQTVKEQYESATEPDHPIPILDTQYHSTFPTLTPVEEEKHKLNVTRMEQSEDINATARNESQINNLNVTIYEISSQNSNNSTTAVKSTNLQSSEYDDHETEMNPFLPEIENNKSLVKILQDGHDIESTVLNETQNENTDEHAPNSADSVTTNTEISNTSSNMSSEAEDKEISNAEDETSFNELLHNENSNESQTGVTKINDTSVISDDGSNKVTKVGEEDRLPSFLTDTEDLVFKQPSTSEVGSEASATTVAPQINNEDLSVVPISEERQELEKHKSEVVNDISDAINASAERTLDATKSNFDDNEA